MSRIIAATESAGTTLLRALLNEIRQLPKPWEQTPEAEQQVVIDRLRNGVESAVRGLVKAVAIGAFPSIPCVVESVTFKDGVKAAVKLSKGHEGTHALADATGGAAMIVLASAGEFLKGMNQVQADVDQAALDLGEPSSDQEQPSEEARRAWDELVASLEQTLPVEGEEQPPAKSMGQQVQDILAKVHVHVPLEACERWTEQECIAAAYWAIQCEKDPKNAPARPHWLPLPCEIAPGHTRVFQTPDALAAYVDVPLDIYQQVQGTWGEKEGAPGYDDYVAAIEASKPSDESEGKEGA